MTDQTFIRDLLANPTRVRLRDATDGGDFTALARVVMGLVEELEKQHPWTAVESRSSDKRDGDGRKGAAGEPAPEVAPHQDDFETVREHIKGWTPRRGNHDKVLALLDRLQDRMRRMEGALEQIVTAHTWNVARAALGARTDGK